jgi:WD40 repeat protein
MIQASGKKKEEGLIDIPGSAPTQKEGYAWTVAFTPDGKQAVTGGGNALAVRKAAEEGSLLLWDLAIGKEIRRFQGHTKDVRRVAISPDGKQLLSGSFDGTMRLWDLQTGKEIRRFDGPGHFVEAVAFTPEGKRVVCSYGPRGVEAIYNADPRCSIRLWDLEPARNSSSSTDTPLRFSRWHFPATVVCSCPAVPIKPCAYGKCRSDRRIVILASSWMILRGYCRFRVFRWCLARPAARY